MAKSKGKADVEPCEWLSGPDAFKKFATHKGKTQSARHIKPLHWYIACRLVIEGGFRPEDITPRPPFWVEPKTRKGKIRYILHYDPKKGGSGEQVVLGGLKTKNVDVVVNKQSIGPVLAVSCKGVTKAFRNLTNRMEETIGECTNLHITYPAMVVGYYAIMRANRTIKDALSAPTVEDDAAANDQEETGIEEEIAVEEEVTVQEDGTVEDETTVEEGTEVKTSKSKESSKLVEHLKANDIAILEDGSVVDGIFRFHAALCEMTGRRGLRDEISRYEAMSIALIDPHEETAGNVFDGFPSQQSPLNVAEFFKTLYQRYEERFVYGAPLLADRGITTRVEWAPESPVFVRDLPEAAKWPHLDYLPRLAGPMV